MDIVVFTGDRELKIADDCRCRDNIIINFREGYSIVSLFEQSCKDDLIKYIEKDNDILSYNWESPDRIVFDILNESSLKVATAESLTAGGLGEALTNYPGSSKFYVGSIVAYSNTIKKKILKVPEEILNTKGAVSFECAEHMARSIAELFESDIGVSLTGVAGPSTSYYKEIGETYIGIFYKGEINIYRYIFKGNRYYNRKSAVNSALYGIWKVIKNEYG